jgi:hypothetical protein
MGLLAKASVAIDGSKFKVVNNGEGLRQGEGAAAACLAGRVARYLSQLDTADRKEPTEALAAKATRLTEKLTKLKEEMGKLVVYANENAGFAGPANLPDRSRQPFDREAAAALALSATTCRSLSTPRIIAYRCPAGERVPYRYTNEEDAKALCRYEDHSLSNLFARIGIHDRRMSICSMLCSGVLIQTQTRCASVERQSSIRSGPCGARMRATYFLSETSSRRDGSIGSCLRSDNLNICRGRAADRCDSSLTHHLAFGCRSRHP